MRITKMHGLGNDYLYVNGFEETLEDPSGLARRASDRHFGVGSDGLILIQPPTGAHADCRMEMYNADGSRAEMCGNGIRCVAKYLRDRGMVSGNTVRVETDSGIRVLEVLTPGSDRSSVSLVTVDMGIPILARGEIPARIGGPDGSRAVEIPLEVPGLGNVTSTLVSMGNPHCVVLLGENQPFQDSLEELRIESIGPLFENHSAFPQRVNTEFVEVRNSRELDFRVWERGSGETMACGTGACAAVVAGALGGWCETEAVVHLRGGDLEIRWDRSRGNVFMTGPATEVFTAELHPRWISEDV